MGGRGAARVDDQIAGPEAENPMAEQIVAACFWITMPMVSCADSPPPISVQTRNWPGLKIM